MTIRLPDDVRLELEALGAVLVRPQWRVLVDAIRAYAGTGPTTTEEQRRHVRRLTR
jgi:predicted transcriptional regulator